MMHPNEAKWRQWSFRIGTWMHRPVPHKIRSIRSKLGSVIDMLEDALFSKRYGVNCSGFIEKHDLKTAHITALPHSQAYQAVTCTAIRELLGEALKTDVEFDNFIDLGSGKGKACFFASTMNRFKMLVGVEFSAQLVEISKANADRFGKENIVFINDDAARYRLPTGTNLIFLFNPFGEAILREFLENNIEHFRKNRSMIAYSNDQHRHRIMQAGFATIFRNQETQGSLYQHFDHNVSSASAP